MAEGFGSLVLYNWWCQRQRVTTIQENKTRLLEPKLTHFYFINQSYTEEKGVRGGGIEVQPYLPFEVVETSSLIENGGIKERRHCREKFPPLRHG